MNFHARLWCFWLCLGTSCIIHASFAQGNPAPGLPLSNLYWLADDWASPDGTQHCSFSASGDSTLTGTWNIHRDPKENSSGDSLIFSSAGMQIQSTTAPNSNPVCLQLSASSETEWLYKSDAREFRISRKGFDTLQIGQQPGMEPPMTLLRTPRIQRFEMPGVPSPVIMRKFWHLTYLLGTDRSQTKEEATRIQTGHLEHLGILAKTGKACVAGPTDGIGEVRGFIIFTTATVEEAVFLANLDPAVKAGRLSYRIDPWWAMEGAVLK